MKTLRIDPYWNDPGTMENMALLKKGTATLKVVDFFKVNTADEERDPLIIKAVRDSKYGKRLRKEDCKAEFLFKVTPDCYKEEFDIDISWEEEDSFCELNKFIEESEGIWNRRFDKGISVWELLHKVCTDPSRYF